MLQLRSNIHTNKKIVAAPLSFHPKRGRLPSNPRAREILALHRVLPPEEQMPARTLWRGPPRRKSQTVAQRWPPTGRSCREGPLRKGSPEIPQSFLMMSLPSRVVISLTFLTDSAEMRALPILPARAHALQQSNTDEHQCGSSARY